jgi:hypothetical protein
MGRPKAQEWWLKILIGPGPPGPKESARIGVIQGKLSNAGSKEPEQGGRMTGNDESPEIIRRWPKKGQIRYKIII